MRSRYKIHDDNYPYFVTSTIVNWIKIFTSEKYFEILLNNFSFYQKKYSIDIIAYVIMSEHFHMICACNKIENAMQSLKSFSAKEIILRLKIDCETEKLNKLSDNKLDYKKSSNYQIWQEGYHPKMIKDYEMLKQKIEYIHYNPVRRKLVDNPEDWKYSSAGFYLKGEDCGLKITPYR